MDAVIKRILKSVIETKNGCLEYPANTSGIRIDGKMISFSKLIYEGFIGNLLYKSRIMRSCSNGKCLNPQHMLPSSPEDKFWSHVEETKYCWNWIGAIDGGGYGCFNCSLTEERKAHRISWELFNGKIPKSMWVLHMCDNSSCVNPEHLFLGTHRDNMQDKVKKERQSRMIGMRNGRSILTVGEVIAIREMYGEGEWSYKRLASLFEISQTQIARIIKRESWSWVD